MVGSDGSMRFDLRCAAVQHALWLRAAGGKDHNRDSDFASLTLEVGDVASR